MGHGIAQSFAQAGYPVMLHDVAKEQVEGGFDRIRQNLDTFVSHGLITRQDASKTLRRITTTTSVHEASADADLIEEAVFEDMGVKRALYRALELACRPDTIIASNTSGMMPTQLAAEMIHPERFLVAHFWKPPYLVRLVEVVAGQRTAASVLDQVCQFLESVDKKPIVVQKEVPGYIGNRIQYAIIREAAHIVAQGIARTQDVDTAIVEGFGIRFGFAGIFQIADLAGLDLVSNICSYLLADLGTETGVPEVIAQKVAEGHIGARAGRGFYEWTPEERAAIQGRWDAALIQQLCRKR